MFMRLLLVSVVGLAMLFALVSTPALNAQGLQGDRPAAGVQDFSPWMTPELSTPDNWLGGPGNWNNVALWSTGAMPNSGNDVSINNSTPAAVVSLNVSDTINNLSIGSTSVLSFNGSTSLTVGGTAITNSNSTGTGGITLNNSSLIIGSSAVSLSGGGTVTLSNSSGNLIYGSAGANVLTNVDNTIQGAGNIGNGALVLVNEGTIDANQSTALKIQPSSTVTNSGTMEATNGAVLDLVSGTYNNAGGIISAGANSQVTFQNVTINGGTLSSGTGGVLFVSGSPTLNGVTINGFYQLNNTNSTTIEGTITNTGTIEMLGCCQTANLILGGSNVTLAGSGTVTMGNSGGAYIYGASSADVLTNNNTIQGYGNIGFTGSTPSMGLVNQGTINGNAASSNYSDPMVIWTSNGTTNTGTLEATAGGILILKNDTFNNAGGTIVASGDNGSGIDSVVEIQNATIVGGTLSTVGNGQMQATGNPTLNGVTINGTYQVNNTASTTMVGTITNTGNISMGGCCQTDSLILGGSGVTLAGSGTVTMSNTGGAYIYGASAGDVLTNSNTIQGFGNIGFTGSTPQMGLINHGTIDATNSNTSDPLTIWTSNGTTNTGTLEATGGAQPVLKNDTFSNSGGTILASGNGTVELLNSTIVGGTLTTSTGGVIAAGGNPTLNGVTNSGTYAVNNTTNTTLEGTINNTGNISMGGCCQTDNLILGGSSVTLTGNGTITMSNTGGAFIYGASSTDVLTNAGNTIEGFGNIGNGAMGLINGPGGTILANSTTELYIKPSASGFTNNGTVEANSGSTLDITGGVFTNFNSGTGTLTGGTYNANGGTIQFDNANIVTNAADIVLTGSGSQIVSNTNSNALANFATNAAGGVFQLGAGRSFTTSAPGGGNFTNNGTLIVGAGDTFKVAGSLSNFSGTTLTGGAYYVAGTLQFGSSGSSVTTNDANLTLAGANPNLLDLAGNNLLTGLNTNGSAGTFTVAAGGSYATPGNFTNAGTMDVEQASSLTVSGNLANTGTVATNNQNGQGGANTFAVTGTLTNSTGGKITIGVNNHTSDVANIGLLANSGTVTVGAGAALNLTSNGADTSAGAITLEGGTLDMQSGSFTNSSTIDLEQKGALTIAGNITNSGAITTNNANLGGGPNAITVTGTLTNNSGASMTVGANNDTSDTASIGILSNGGTVTVDKGATLKLTSAGTDTNTGTITVNNGTLSLASAADLDMEQGGKLAVTGTLTNAGAITTNTNNQGGRANTITVSGRVTNNAGASFTIGANNDTSDTASFGSLANSGSVTVGTGANLTLSTASANTDAGSLAVDGTLDSKGSIALSGTGSLTLTNGTVTATGSNATLKTGAHNTISGSGTISNFGVTNAGTLSANQAAPLIILPSAAGLDNTGTIKVSAGDTMEIGTSAGGAFTNFSGTTLTGGIYNLTGTLQFGASGTTIATNAANITLNGSGEMMDFGGHNILAGFNNNLSTGVFKLASGAALTTAGGSFTNAGTFTVSTGTTFTIGGSSFNFLQTAGSTTVAGTLNSSSLGTVNLDGGTLTGAGTIGDNLVDDSTLDPGTSAAKTGKLTVADTYTQDAGGTLNIQINGAAPVTKYDQLKVTGSATLGGVLNIDLGSFTPSIGEKFTILSASSVADQFTTVNGLAINSNEHFTITYNAGTVVLTVVNGALTASSNNQMITQAIYPGLYHRTMSLARVPAASATAPVWHPVSFAASGMGMRALRPRDEMGAPAAFSATTGDAPVAGGMGLSPGLAPVSALAYNSMSAMNHMRFECGLNLKALMKTSRKQLVRALWAAPDSPEALSIGYMSFIGSH